MKVICFDLDDTLIDFKLGEMKARLAFIKRLAERSKTPLQLVGSKYDNIWSQIKPDYMEMVKKGLNEKEIRNVHFNRLVEEIHYDGTITDLDKMHWDYSLENFEVYSDADSVIKYLSKKYRLTMITNGPSDLQSEKIKRLNFSDIFEEILISGDIGHHKPDLKIFQELTRRTGVDASDVVYIGNNYQKDVVGAHQAGWKTVWVNRNNEDIEKITPTWTIKELSELLKIF